MDEKERFLYQTIIEGLSAGVLLIGENRRILMCNASAERFLGMADDAEGKTLAEAFFESESESYDKLLDIMLEAILNDNESYNVPVDLSLSGETKHFIASSYGIDMGDGKRASVLVLEDITELSALRDASKAAKEIGRLKDSIGRRDEILEKTFGQGITEERVDEILENGAIEKASDDKQILISLKGVKKEYHSGDSVLKVLRGIDLDIYEHEFLVVLGESGCGKSTMMNIVGGMDFLTDGTFLVEGKDYSHPSEKELTNFRRNYVGFIFQSYNLMPNLTALQNISFIAEIAKDPMKPEDAIAKVGLSERANNFPHQMSGGQQQRVSIARALVKNPTLILADEPTAALDYATSIEVLSVVEDVVRSQGKTVVMITHNDEIAKMADRVVKLKDGVVSSIRTNLHPLSAKDLVW